MTKEHSLTPYEKSLEELKDNLCPYCLTDKRQRNPTGLCDHLYYPEAANPDCIIGIAVNNYERLREENEYLKSENEYLKKELEKAGIGWTRGEHLNHY